MVVVAFSMFMLVGFAALSVDVGWYYVQSLSAKKAAEAGALAGAVHLPLPTGVSLAGSIAENSALDLTGEHGYPDGSVTVSFGGSDGHLKVAIATTTPAFFSKIFGYDTLGINRFAVAEALPTLKIGSDDNSIGGPSEHFWLALNGDRRKKEDGDPFTTICMWGDGCGSASNDEYRGPTNTPPTPNYYYAVEVPDSAVGNSLSIEVYDGPHYAEGWRPPAGEPGDRTEADKTVITFEVFEPDETPYDWTDNSDSICTHTFGDVDSVSDPGVREWVSICTDSAIRGIYVIHVTISSNAGGSSGRAAITDFALRSNLSDTSVYGLGSMSLDMVDVGTAPRFTLAKILPIYAGTELIVSLYDAGDATGSADLTFVGSLGSVPCQYRVRGGADGQTLIQDWGTGLSPCFIDTSGQLFNHKWVDFRFPIPAAYTCDPALGSGVANSCWMDVDYNFVTATQVNERTTWSARINGQPVHLLPGG